MASTLPESWAAQSAPPHPTQQLQLSDSLVPISPPVCIQRWLTSAPRSHTQLPQTVALTPAAVCPACADRDRARALACKAHTPQAPMHAKQQTHPQPQTHTHTHHTCASCYPTACACGRCPCFLPWPGCPAARHSCCACCARRSCSSGGSTSSGQGAAAVLPRAIRDHPIKGQRAVPPEPSLSNRY